jgi:hypothetical protein
VAELLAGSACLGELRADGVEISLGERVEQGDHLGRRAHGDKAPSATARDHVQRGDHARHPPFRENRDPVDAHPPQHTAQLDDVGLFGGADRRRRHDVAYQNRAAVLVEDTHGAVENVVFRDDPDQLPVCVQDGQAIGMNGLQQVAQLRDRSVLSDRDHFGAHEVAGLHGHGNIPNRRPGIMETRYFSPLGYSSRAWF